MYRYIYVYTYKYIYLYLYIYEYIYTCTPLPGASSRCWQVYICIYVCVYMYIYEHVYTYIYVHAYICIYMCVHTYIYEYTYPCMLLSRGKLQVVGPSFVAAATDHPNLASLRVSLSTLVPLCQYRCRCVSVGASDGGCVLKYVEVCCSAV